MKIKILLSVIFLLAFGTMFSQQCLSDEYLDTYIAKDPKLMQKVKEVVVTYTLDDMRSEASVLAEENRMIVIPVVFNVIHTGEAVGVGKNISAGKINEQITYLNNLYGGYYNGTNTMISFCLATKNIFGQEVSGINRFLGRPTYDVGTFSGEICTFNPLTDSSIKLNVAHGLPSDSYLNIWTCDLLNCGVNNLNGYSSFPFPVYNVPDIENNVLDGVVLDYKYVGTNTETGSTGIVGAHEIGHWLGLFHTFKDFCNVNDCANEGDMICDTDNVPATGVTNFISGSSCLGNKCGGGTTTSVQNIMDYQTPQRFSCQIKITPDQKRRMRDNLQFYRGRIFNTTISITTCSSSSTANCSPSSPQTTNISAPDLPYYRSIRRIGNDIEVNDKWFVAQDVISGRDSNDQILTSYVRVFKRNGCDFNLFQSLPVPFSWPEERRKDRDSGLILNGDEIIFNNNVNTYVYKFSEVTNLWSLSQTLPVSSNYNITSSYILDNFLFVFEQVNSEFFNNRFKIYFKNATGQYAEHQILSVPGKTISKLGEQMAAHNSVREVVNFNSATFTGSYDPLEIYFPTLYGMASIGLLPNHKWGLIGTFNPPELPPSEYILDIAITAEFIYVLSSENRGGGSTAPDILNLTTFRTSANTGWYGSIASRTRLYGYDEFNGISGYMEMKVVNNTDMYIVGQYGVLYYYNAAELVQSSVWPNWRRGGTATCDAIIGPGDIEIVGNLLFKGLSVADISEIKTKRKPEGEARLLDYEMVIAVPERITTASNKIELAGYSPLTMSGVKRNFIASEYIRIGSDATIFQGSDVTFKISSLCNSMDTTSDRQSFRKSRNEDVEIMEIEESLSLDEKFVLYPNPTSDKVTVNFKNGYLKNVTVSSIDGKTMLNARINREKSYTIDASNYSNGIYIVSVETDQGEFITQKLIKN